MTMMMVECMLQYLCFFIVPNCFELWIDSPLKEHNNCSFTTRFLVGDSRWVTFLTSDPAPANLTKSWLENQPWDPWDHLPERWWNLPWRTAAVVWGGRTKMQAGSTSSQLARGATTKISPNKKSRSEIDILCTLSKTINRSKNLLSPTVRPKILRTTTITTLNPS